ncbi:hypothetical protein [Magnetococcus marinus]|uniref:hypothetical protein n=1 Tax=Magnetococcus marinus TaxID=1124597 RepID=UPI0000381540|nr:hypothetical protein [Magnetococcus marinus]
MAGIESITLTQEELSLLNQAKHHLNRVLNLLNTMDGAAVSAHTVGGLAVHIQETVAQMDRVLDRPSLSASMPQ